MKRFIVIAIVALTIIFITVPVQADFNAKVQKDIRQELGAFYQRNEGSKITIDLMDGLMLHLNQIFDNNLIKVDPKKVAPGAELELKK